MQSPRDSRSSEQNGSLSSLESSLGVLQSAVRQALLAVGIRKPGPTSIGRCLGLDKSIAWKLGRIAKARHPLEALEYVPGQQGARIVVDALTSSGLSAEKGAELGAAFDELERQVETHAGDRRTALAMARALRARVEAPPIDENLRRDHFRTSSAIWGAQARVLLKTSFVAPGAEPHTVDLANFEGVIELLRLRSDVRWRVARKSVTHNDRQTGATFEPLDPALEADAPPYFWPYCSDPLPALEIHHDADGHLNYELPPGAIGKTEAVTCTIATRSCVGVRPGPEEETFDLTSGIYLGTPCEHMVLDFFVHRALVPTAPPRAGILSQLMVGPTIPTPRDRQQLPIPLEIEELTTPRTAESLTEVPDYRTALHEALGMAGAALGADRWRLTEFLGYRVRLRYPPIPSSGLVTVGVARPR